ncbi:MAG TPA: hypothetical protein VFZ46_00930 [Nitrososphaeraceae archaeon]
MICEAPILIDDVFSLVNVIIQWCFRNNVKELIVLEGILKQYFSSFEDREEKTIILINENVSKQKENIDKNKKCVEKSLSNY